MRDDVIMFRSRSGSIASPSPAIVRRDAGQVGGDVVALDVPARPKSTGGGAEQELVAESHDRTVRARFPGPCVSGVRAVCCRSCCCSRPAVGRPSSSWRRSWRWRVDRRPGTSSAARCRGAAVRRRGAPRRLPAAGGLPHPAGRAARGRGGWVAGFEVGVGLGLAVAERVGAVVGDRRAGADARAAAGLVRPPTQFPASVPVSTSCRRARARRSRRSTAGRPRWPRRRSRRRPPPVSPAATRRRRRGRPWARVLLGVVVAAAAAGEPSAFPWSFPPGPPDRTPASRSAEAVSDVPQQGCGIAETPRVRLRGQAWQFAQRAVCWATGS